MEAVQTGSGLAETDHRKTVFFGSLAFVTAIPLLGLGFGLGFLHPVGPQSPALLMALGPVLAATGIAHVALTSYLYVDGGFRDLVSQNRARFMLWPLLAAAIALAAFEAGAWTNRALLIVGLAWSLHHYQRQNFGMISFAAQDRRLGALPKALRHVLDLSTVGGVCFVIAPGLPMFAGLLHALGATCFVASTVVLTYLLLANRRIVSDPVVLGFAVLSWAFFLPSMLSNDVLISFSSYAIGHGAQYLIFMSVLSGKSPHGAKGPLVLVGVTGATYLAFQWLNLSQAGVAIYSGLTMGHFMIDAKVWRMREPLQRSLIKQRFAFLFD